jgi:hypothetical protein
VELDDAVRSARKQSLESNGHTYTFVRVLSIAADGAGIAKPLPPGPIDRRFPSGSSVLHVENLRYPSELGGLTPKPSFHPGGRGWFLGREIVRQVDAADGGEFPVRLAGPRSKCAP